MDKCTTCVNRLIESPLCRTCNGQCNYKPMDGNKK